MPDFPTPLDKDNNNPNNKNNKNSKNSPKILLTNSSLNSSSSSFLLPPQNSPPSLSSSSAQQQISPTFLVGNLLVSNDGKSASLSQADGLTTTALLVITLAKFYTSTAWNAKLQKRGENLLEVSYDYSNQGDAAVKLSIQFDSESHPDLDFYTFHWKKPSMLEILKDSISLTTADAHWYGGMNLHEQQWPMEKGKYEMSEFVTSDVYQQGVTGQERYWLSSNKVALTVPWSVPLWSSLQNGELELQSTTQESSFLLKNNFLEYTLVVPKCVNATAAAEGNGSSPPTTTKMSLREFHQKCFKLFLRAPTAHPDLAIIQKPIWSTWANFWTAVDQKGVEQFAQQIHEHGMPISQLELDDMWTVAYGDYQIDAKKFSNFSGMLGKINSEFGVPRLSAWVHPFVNADSESGKDPELRNRIFVKNKDGDVPLVWWWDCPVKPEDPSKPVGPNNPDKHEPCAYVLDLTNPDARDWWQAQLNGMLQEGIHTFKFDAGETNWLPANFVLHFGDHPNSYSQHYAHFSARFGPSVENRFGSGTQQTNFFTRTMDRNSYWDENGGLSTLIPWALQSSLHGYFWNLPDMIGGNGLNHNASNIRGEPPEAELYIRWTQANALLLAMQFSYPPWHSKYGVEVLEHVKRALAIRERWMPYILESVKEAVEKKAPVIRPMWWESDAPLALASSDQFMLGTDLVVAPVIKKGATFRDVFLPPGDWQDGNNASAEAIKGPTVVKDYPAPLDVLPHFHRVESWINGGNACARSGLLLGLLLPLFTALWAMMNFAGFYGL